MAACGATQKCEKKPPLGHNNSKRIWQTIAQRGVSVEEIKILENRTKKKQAIKIKELNIIAYKVRSCAQGGPYNECFLITVNILSAFY